MIGCVTVSSQEGTYQERLGSTTSTEAVDAIRETLQVRYSYVLDREVVSQEEIRFTTQWKEHSVNSEERREGFTASRTRIEVRARPKSRFGGGVRDYRVQMTADYQVQIDGGEWTIEALPSSRTEYLQEIADVMANEFKGGTREM